MLMGCKLSYHIVRRSRRPPVAVERKAREVAPAFHVFHPEAFMAALWAGNHEVVLADLPALLGAARLYLALVRAEKTRRTRRYSTTPLSVIFGGSFWQDFGLSDH